MVQCSACSCHACLDLALLHIAAHFSGEVARRVKYPGPVEDRFLDLVVLVRSSRALAASFANHGCYVLSQSIEKDGERCCD